MVTLLKPTILCKQTVASCDTDHLRTMLQALVKIFFLLCWANAQKQENIVIFFNYIN